MRPPVKKVPERDGKLPNKANFLAENGVRRWVTPYGFRADM